MQSHQKALIMKSRYTFLSTLLFSSSMLLALTTAKATWVDGWELGARTGLMSQHGTLKIMASAGADTLNRERYIADSGWLGGLFVGYNWKEDLVTLGLNLNLDWNGIDDDHHFHALDSSGDNYLATVRYERDFFYAVSGRVGYRAWESITPFVRVGIERSTNRLHFKADNVNNPAIPVNILDASLSHHKTGYLLGIGIDIPVYNKNTNLRIEYNYHLCGTIEFGFGNANIGGKAEYQPKAHVLTVGVQWGQV